MLRYSGEDGDLEAFLADNPSEDVVLMFDLSQERIDALGREVEVRKFKKSVVSIMGAGTTVVHRVEVERQVVLRVPEEDPEKTQPEAQLKEDQTTSDVPDLPES